jgi:hypothetical protein
MLLNPFTFLMWFQSDIYIISPAMRFDDSEGMCGHYLHWDIGEVNTILPLQVFTTMFVEITFFKLTESFLCPCSRMTKVSR